MNLTAEQIAKVAINYVLKNTSKLQVLKITKQTKSEYGVDIVNVRVINSVGKKSTSIVYVTQAQDFVCGDFYSNGRQSVSDLINLELTNPVFDTIEEEQAKIDSAKEIADKEEAERNFSNYMIRLRSEYKRYNQRSQLGLFERMLKKESIQTLESYLPFQDGELKKLIERCITKVKQKEIETGKNIQYSTKNRTVFYSSEIESVISQIEDSFSFYEEKIYENALKQITEKGDGVSVRTPEQEAYDYVEMQKSRLMCAVIRDMYDLKIISVENRNITNHPNGFEGSWKIVLADNTTKYYETKSILAGGNIQRLHYRYLTKLN